MKEAEKIQLGTKDSTPQNQDFHRCSKCGCGYYANATDVSIVECPYCSHLINIK